MNDRVFDLRMSCRYGGPDNAVAELTVEHFDDGEWRPFDLNARSPGFLVFVYALLTCQHLYLRANCAERALRLGSAAGAIHVVTTEDWDLRTVEILFEGKLTAGIASEADVDYIVARMKQCPVSRNTKKIRDSKTSVRLS